MSSPPPTKPPRGVKQGKETSGLLMSVIRTLSASETNEQREKERAKLEKEYKKSDARLDELVATHAQEIMEVMQKFSSVGAALTVWGQHCDAAVARLAACRGLLRLRRDDLRRLWADARTHHYALQMLTDIERVVVSERETRELISSGRVLAAAHTLREALATADTTLSHVDALKTTRQHLEGKKCELVEVIVRRLSEAVYRDDRAPLSRRLSARRRTALLLAELTKSEEVTDAYLQDITPEFEASLSEEDKTFESTVMISLEALGVLEQLKEATEKFKVQIQTELLEVIESVSRRIIDEGDIEADVECEEDGEIQDGDCVTETGRPLAKLVTTLGEEFRACAARNRRLLQLWRAALQRYKISDSCLHTEQHYWSAVQQVFQLLLTEYLEIESVNLAAQRSSGTATEVVATDLRITDYFAKKRPQRRRTKLFKLTAPVAGSPRSVARRPRAAVCRPDPAHLHAVLPALHALCAHIEPLTGGGECSLRAFITDYVRWGESSRLATTARNSIDEAMRAPGAWRERQPPAQTVRTKMGERHRMIFTCCGDAWRAVADAAAAAARCGSCGGADALKATTSALAALATQCRAAHARLSPAHPPHPSRAARWLADDDIVRFLQSLPNWRVAISQNGPTAKHDAQELREAYEREAETLVSTLGDGAVTRREVITDVNALADLALLCETMDWLCTNIRSLPALLNAPTSTGGSSVKLTDKFMNDITSAAMIFEEISHKCLLFLHLEMRIQCVYHLGQEERDSSNSQSTGGDGDGDAARLAQALLAFHERAAPLIKNSTKAYIMGGVGEMMSAAVVWRWQGEGHSGAATGARLATLRHCLAALRLPHDGLHRAHTYLHLLTCTPEEIITSIREKGAQFSELQYLNAFKVIGTQQRLSPADMRALQNQLSTALGHVGVTV
ncbi:exocyst complex component 4 [Amyelois transitella]|uniref:exocyst complex component 4 n=1 Tax=Amyelois transitella TaxID=680683 RepID=UPI00298F40C7|nr:exocyst complex component 4 [Amyelois transitella]